MPVEIHGKCFEGLLDSGANASLVGRRGWAKLADVSFMGGTEWERLKKEGVTLSKSTVTAVRVANNQKCPVLGRVDLPIRVSDNKKVVSFLVVPDLPHELILGMDFWRAFGLVVDASKGLAGVGEPEVAEVVVARDGLDEQQRAGAGGISGALPPLARSARPRVHSSSNAQYRHGRRQAILPETYKKFQKEIVTRLQKAYERNKFYYNLRRRPVTFKPGDAVYRANHVQSNAASYFSKKLAPKFVGPFTVVKKVGGQGYMLQDEKGVADGPWHVKHLKGVA
ncbi:Transposon Tf2-9 polyprotein [Frankliniella fusca]|uniref:Transposon Tf2-9 polyprotein n=1 Tax=Frankliniella fusca TaxID=407009 RepID=A0AAE1LER8_9NEOP|nr:Transposon Tf2-9 polyprotein [Frankliniella fusca]